ncbi:MAG TPA: methylmalonyl-CoA mutase family protein [Candidatus Nitrosotenuis sp.]|nr:methylmalonyl-CoA mutase family protein [Candidatus Nitrosotenuis sp.]
MDTAIPTGHEVARIRRAREAWERHLSQVPQRKKRWRTWSGAEIQPLYTPDDVAHLDPLEDIGLPGEYPYLRGIHPTMYRSRLWTMRLFSGFATAEETNRRYHLLLQNGQTGLSVAFDMPTLMGKDSDDPLARGEVGVCGVAIDTLEDMETLFRGIPLDQVSTSMTINGPAAILLAMYLAVAEKQGVSWNKVRGTLQNDILKEYIAQKEWLFPPAPSMKLVVDTVEFCTRQVPQWNTISISGYHIREAGATALQELAFTLADGFAYVDACIERGMQVDEFAPRLSYFFDCHNNFFEEIAKFRAARKIYAQVMREKYGARDPRSWKLRFHTQTAGVTLTAQQPENNIVRVAYQALAAVLGGTQSLHTNAMDETLALPSDKAALIALRTQQILAHETGVPDVVDPLAGSYYVEFLTDWMVQECFKYFERIEAVGGVLKGIEEGFFQREIARSAFEYQKAVEAKEEIIVGVNEFVMPDEKIEIPVLKIGPEVERAQIERLQRVRARRDPDAVRQALEKVRAACQSGANVMPVLVEAVKTYASIGEIVAEMTKVYGEYREPVIL